MFAALFPEPLAFRLAEAVTSQAIFSF
jgi:hypothetical protein